MKTGAIVAIVIILILGAVAFMWFSNDADLDIENTDISITDPFDQTPTTTDEDALTGELNTYENAEFDFTFNYPAEAETRVEADRATVIYVGPDAIPNSEITDGFMVGVRTEAYTSDMDVESVAEELFQEQAQTREVIASTTEIAVGNEAAYEFQVESELGTTLTYVVFAADDGQVFVVDYFVEDPANRGYEDAIEDIMQSLQYEMDTEVMSTTTP